MSRGELNQHLPPLSILFVLAVLGGCASGAERRAAENAAIGQQAAVEIDRICSLPQPERKAEVARIELESGIVVQCGND